MTTPRRSRRTPSKRDKYSPSAEMARPQSAHKKKLISEEEVRDTTTDRPRHKMRGRAEAEQTDYDDDAHPVRRDVLHLHPTQAMMMTMAAVVTEELSSASSSDDESGDEDKDGCLGPTCLRHCQPLPLACRTSAFLPFLLFVLHLHRRSPTAALRCSRP